ncbi:hypothetical protein GQF21_11410, partial [Neisseria meningitidis]
AEAGAGIATGAVTVGNAWEAPVGALSKAKAAKQAIPTQTVKELDGLLQESKNIGAVNTRIRDLCKIPFPPDSRNPNTGSPQIPPNSTQISP